MYQFHELKDGKRSLFSKTFIDDRGRVAYERVAGFTLFEVEHEGFSYLVLYDDEMQVNSEFFEYLNSDLRSSPLTTRRKAAHALRNIFCFLSLNNYDFPDLDDSALSEMASFFRGVGFSNVAENPIAPRSNGTINGYFQELRDFCEKRKIECPASLHMRARYDSAGAGEGIRNSPYRSNLRTAPKRVVPKYISLEQFASLLEIVKSDGDAQSEVMMRLMYLYGMRIGEVLGLTTEDVREISEGKGLVPALILRNRVSDKPYQFAKNIPHALTRNQYASTDYRKSAQRVIISRDMYELLVETVNHVHEKARSNPDNYATAAADIVSQEDAPDDNHYLFLNRYGKVLSGQTWNNCLRRLFSKAGIPIDQGVRTHNLSHRFRHGFAMWHAHFRPEPVDYLKLSRMMRHRQPSSTLIYFNLTEEDEHDLVENLESAFLDGIAGAFGYQQGDVEV